MTLQIPDHPFKAYIFDCDGTLVDSMPMHYVAWVEALKRHDAPFEFTEEEFYAHAGIKEQDVVKILNVKHGTRVLKTGDRVRLDGDRGEVRLLERASVGDAAGVSA